MNFHLGCAVWSYKGWVGDFYPPKSHPKDFLRLYSQRFTAVEGNTTFYAVPQRDTLARWAAQTPPGFKFCLKLPKEFTHQGLLQSSIPGALDFLERVGELGDRLGPIFAQLPPSYSPEYIKDLSAFLRVLPAAQIPLALEVRHLDWFKEPHGSQLRGILAQFGVGRVLLDTRGIYNSSDDPQVNSQRRKPKLPLQPSVTAGFSLIRFISHPQREVNQSFLEEWAVRLDSWLRQGLQIYFFVHCPIEGRSPGTARCFQQLLEQRGANVPPLPWNQVNFFPQQLSLF